MTYEPARAELLNPDAPSGVAYWWRYQTIPGEPVRQRSFWPKPLFRNGQFLIILDPSGAFDGVYTLTALAVNPAPINTLLRDHGARVLDDTIREIVRRLEEVEPAQVPVGWFRIQRIGDPPGEGAWLEGDVIRLMAPGEPGANASRGPNFSLINATQLQLQDDDFERLRTQVMSSVIEDIVPGDPDQGTRMVWVREWYVPLQASDNTDLDANGQAFMADLAASLLSDPFLAARSWSALNGVAFKSRVTGQRLTFV